MAKTSAPVETMPQYAYCGELALPKFPVEFPDDDDDDVESDDDDVESESAEHRP